MESKTEVIDRLKKEIDAGINSRESALDEYRPDLEDDVKQKILNESAINIKVDNGETAEGKNTDQFQV